MGPILGDSEMEPNRLFHFVVPPNWTLFLVHIFGAKKQIFFQKKNVFGFCFKKKFLLVAGDRSILIRIGPSFG